MPEIFRLRPIFFALFMSTGTITFGQDIDTLTFYSSAFGTQRSVYVHKPQFYKYASDDVGLPVIYLLDGQHEWFVDPIVSDIRFLQYTHEVPNALIVVIPLTNRNKECTIAYLSKEIPLDIMITDELPEVLAPYHPGDFRILIGHSFSASFALYAYYHHPDIFSAVIAHTPLDELESLAVGFMEKDNAALQSIYISTGGAKRNEDFYHRKAYDQLKDKYSAFFQAIHTFEADHSAHNAVPIVATPALLTSLFDDFSSRFANLAKVDDMYKLIDVPASPEKEMEKVMAAATLGPHFYPPEIAEINGIASRYAYSGYDDIATAVYTMGIGFYPHFYEFYLSLYELTSPHDPQKARAYLEKAAFLLQEVEGNWEGKDVLLDEIEVELLKIGE